MKINFNHRGTENTKRLRTDKFNAKSLCVLCTSVRKLKHTANNMSSDLLDTNRYRKFRVCKPTTSSKFLFAQYIKR
jgi:hypothetical protein